MVMRGGVEGGPGSPYVSGFKIQDVERNEIRMRW
jgi:hypothetical protein